MRKTIAVLGSALFFAVAPSSVAGLVPWWITRWEFRPPFFDLDATRAVENSTAGTTNCGAAFNARSRK